MSRRWTLVVMGHGRWEYFFKALESLPMGLGFFDRTVLAYDGPRADLDLKYQGVVLGETRCTGQRSGLTANMAQALDALTDEDEWVFWLEEDFLVHDAPLDAMADTLEAYPNVANMVLLRQPWGAHEIAVGSVLKAQHYDLAQRDGWIEHTGGFWLNPFVAHASLLRSLQAGVETDLTAQCRARGLSFGYWGKIDDPPRVEHIGYEQGMGSPGWKA